MTITTIKRILFQIGTFKFRYEISAQTPVSKGKSWRKFALLALAIPLAAFLLGTAATAGDPDSFKTVLTVWGEIKPVLILLLECLKR